MADTLNIFPMMNGFFIRANKLKVRANILLLHINYINYSGIKSTTRKYYHSRRLLTANLWFLAFHRLNRI